MEFNNNIPKEHTLSVNEFNVPEVLEGKDAISQLLIHLILLEPGTISSKPKMGVGLISRYRYNSKESLDILKRDIQEQVSIYLPEFNSVKVDIGLDPNDEMIIDINIDNTVYKYETSKQKDNKIRLSELNI